MKNIRLLALTLFLGLTIASYGQQKELYTQYMFNGLTINPAYAGTHDAVSLTGMSRWQWAGFEGAPTTQTFSIHSPIKGKNVGLGLLVSRDEIGVTNTTNISGMYSYRIAMGSGYLSMGVQGTVTNFKGDYSTIFTTGVNDQSFVDVSEFSPNFGAGVFYYTSKFYIGVSAPELMNSKIESEGGSYTQQRHYFLNSGLVFNLSQNVKLKPNLLVKMVDGAPVSADYNLNALFSDFIWLGVSVRPPESVSGIVQVNVSPKLSLGYSYDHIIQEQLQQISNASHEVMVNYRIQLSKDRVVTPRYF
jgi:type IX secretion system PorP/SprF family membrane protein